MLTRVRAALRVPVDDTLAAMEHVMAGGRPVIRFASLGVGLVVAWYVYVPIHELLHAAGCAAAGGTVSVLEIQVQYGGALLAHVFPFVEPGGDYAGRLSGFDTHGSDLVYLATDALPFALSALLGVPLMRSCARRARPAWFGAAVVLGLAPFYNIPGDYYEMGSILATRLVGAFGSNLEGLRADDLFLLLQDFVTQPETLGIAPGEIGVAIATVAAGLVLAVALAFGTYALGDWIAARWIGSEPDVSS